MVHKTKNDAKQNTNTTENVLDTIIRKQPLSIRQELSYN